MTDPHPADISLPPTVPIDITALVEEGRARPAQAGALGAPGSSAGSGDVVRGIRRPAVRP